MNPLAFTELHPGPSHDYRLACLLFRFGAMGVNGDLQD